MKKISPVTSLLNIFTKKSRKFVVLTVIAGLTIIVIAIAIPTVFLVQKSKANSCSSERGRAVLAKADQNLHGNQKEDLRPVIGEIKTFSDHEQNVDCLYVLTHYYITVTNNENATKYYTLLQKQYDPGTGFSNAISAGEYEYDELGEGMEFLKIFEEEAKRNSEIFEGTE